VGALVNAQAVAGAVSDLLSRATLLDVTVLACGERWQTPDEEGALRFAVEDYLGAGVILSALPFSQTREAQVCTATFQAMRDQLDAALWECESGRELRAKGLGDDVRFAAQLDIYDTAPILPAKRLEPTNLASNLLQYLQHDPLEFIALANEGPYYPRKVCCINLVNVLIVHTGVRVLA
jgi:2-phosphosulfolactate phosphatase